MDIDILSLFPEAFEGPLDASMIKRARQLGLLNIQTVDLREFGEGTRFFRLEKFPADENVRVFETSDSDSRTIEINVISVDTANRRV